MNQFLQFRLKKANTYKFVVTNPENNINKEFSFITGSGDSQDIQLVLSK